MTVLGNLTVGQGNSGVLLIDASTCVVSGEISLQPGSAINIINSGTLQDQ